MTSPTNPTREAQPSATPRTDAAVEYAYARKLNMKEVADVIEDQAKQSETELQQANARERDLKDELAKRDAELAEQIKSHEQTVSVISDAIRERDAARAELARLKAGSGDVEELAQRLEKNDVELRRSGIRMTELIEAAQLLRAKAELCDRLAAALKRTVTAIDAGFGKAQRDHIKAQATEALERYRESRAAGPADAGGGRE